MAERIWIGGAVGYENAWNHAGNWSGGVLPGVGDDVYLVSSPHAIAGFDASGIALASFNVAASMTGNLGSSAAPLRISADLVRFDGRQTQAWLELANQGTPLTAVHVNATKHTTAPAVEGLHLRFVDDCPALYLRDGLVTVEAGGAGDLALVVIMGGTHTLRVPVAEIENLGGTATLDADVGNLHHIAGTTIVTSGTCAAVRIHAGAVRWNSSGDINGVLTVFGGTFDAAGNTHAFAIQRTIIYNGVVDTRGGLGQPTFVEAPSIHGRSGVLYVDAGRTLTVG